MSADDVEEPVDSPDDPTDDAGDDMPPIEDDEVADLSAVADSIEASSGAGAEDDSGDAGDENSADNDAGDDAGENPALEPRRGSREWGDMYVSSITQGLNTVIETHGRPGAEPIEESMARDLHLDEAFDEWMELRGRSEMEPHQEVMLGTMMLAGSVVLSKTTLANDALSQMKSEDDDD